MSDDTPRTYYRFATNHARDLIVCDAPIMADDPPITQAECQRSVSHWLHEGESIISCDVVPKP